jgi:predicted nucleic acid-binding protein
VNESRLVVNASPLILLAAIDALPLLSQLVDQVLLPEAVLGEVLAKTEPRLSLQNLSSTTWVRVEADVSVPDDVASWDLGAGETQVLALGRLRGDVELVLDDRQARRCAELLGLPTTGTLGLILRAKWRGFIPAARPLVERLIEHRLYLAHDLAEAALAEVGE